VRIHELGFSVLSMFSVLRSLHCRRGPAQHASVWITVFHRPHKL